MSDTSYKLDELAQAAGVSPRTVRYYVQRGLLPPPVFRGRDTAYSADHLLRLRAIRRLQDRHLPLDLIQVELGRRSGKELERLADGKDDADTTRMVLIPPPILVDGKPLPPPSGGMNIPSVPRVSGPGQAGQAGQAGRAGRAFHGEPAGWLRLELADGLELHLSEHADERAQALFEDIRNHVARRRTDGEHK